MATTAEVVLPPKPAEPTKATTAPAEAVFDPSRRKKKRATVAPVVEAAPAPAAEGRFLCWKEETCNKACSNSCRANKGGDPSKITDSLGVGISKEPTPAPAQPGSPEDRDYTYEELAQRIFTLMQRNNPEFANRQRKFIMKPPQVCKEGTKKTVWMNFAEICQIMHRPPEHVLQYVFAELGTTGSLDGKQQLVIRGRYQIKSIETLIRKYIGEYVSCWTCNQPDTTLKKENRLSFVVCESCGSKRSVAAIKKGFEAQIGKRKLMRSKAGES
ncbi:eukaryotic translation initiation factor 2 subunit beta [Pelomyxa schiedti]|nr:eukaryotic translation initiation factor 2 subunit beta [Pelomyxa schiedti]